MPYDLKITGGTIIDGTGAPRFRGDLGIRDGRMVALGKAPDSARRTINADGRIVCPGFVDIHTHYDAQLLWDHYMTVSPWHGVTTAVMGNCGFTLAPNKPAHRDMILRTLERVEGMNLAALEAGIGRDWGFSTYPEYLDAVERRGVGINVASMIGHTAIRMYVMGEASVERAATRDEIAGMQNLVAEALEAGSTGFSTSIINAHHGFDGKPVASRLAAPEERVALAQTVGRAKQGMIQIVGAGGSNRPWDEYTALARASGRNVCWAVIKGSQTNEGGHRRELEQTRQHLANGLNLYPQAACRPTVFEYSFSDPVALSKWSLFKDIRTAASAGEKIRVLSDSGFRERFRRMIDGPSEYDVQMGAYAAEAAQHRQGFCLTEISWYPPERKLESRLALDVAKERGMHVVDLMLDMTLKTALEARFRTPQDNFDEDQLQEVLQDPNVVLGLGDAGAHLSQLCDAVYTSYLLQRWVRERRAFTLEQAIYKLTSFNAGVFGVTDRGRLAEGWPADVLVFDPERIAPLPLERVYDLPAGADRLISKPVGVDAVIVNGTVLPPPGEALALGEALPGRLLRGGAAAPA